MSAENTEDAIRRIAQVVVALSEEGFIVTGEVSVVKPKVPGLVVGTADLHLGEMASMVLRTERATPPELPTLPPPPPQQVVIPLDKWMPINFTLDDPAMHVPSEVNKAIGEALFEELKEDIRKLDKTLTDQAATHLGYTGNACTCGSMRMVRRGACEYCEDCGSSSGCS